MQNTVNKKRSARLVSKWMRVSSRLGASRASGTYGKAVVFGIFEREGPKISGNQPKRGWLWLNAGSCVRLRPQYRGHVWSDDLIAGRTHDGKAFRMLAVIDKHGRECLAIHVQRKLKSDDGLAVLTELFERHGPAGHIRSDNAGGVYLPRRARRTEADQSSTPSGMSGRALASRVSFASVHSLRRFAPACALSPERAPPGGSV